MRVEQSGTVTLQKAKIKKEEDLKGQQFRAMETVEER